ncbi:glycosyltransferase [Actinobacillus equuli subsp. haemolyticus]|uniref:glycosyl transferase n=1 Tax=Actinobacillus equuli TaxID=718 RepID=UPI0024427300|nr:glycosyl transferase [Actinobacillus equuli]WGE63107.1 glycosyltransferase [Actinobacillus equuli subsp. haemolyticus]
MHIIQSSVYPKLSLCTQVDLYFRLNQFSSINIKDTFISFEKMGKLSTDTYFNSMSIGKWKNHTNIDNLSFTIQFKGKFKVTWLLYRLHFSLKILDELFIESSELTRVTIPLEFWKDLEDGMLAFELEAVEAGSVYNFAYNTSIQPKNTVSLGVVITHFNRQQYVLPALERLKKELLEDINFSNKVSLNVVDNSQNLPKLSKVNIIPNENLGGSGGFTRGLMTLKEAGSYTHCLFMDDDASCEVEGIKRTIALLEYAKDSRTAVAGAMLREAEMFRQFENGAKFDGMCRAIKPNLDLRDIHSLLINEQEENIDYGGWWFFAFPLSEVKYYAFPYFVRGDDSGFSLAHEFNIISLNGISSWQEDFALKNGPLPHYLDTRYHIMHQFHNFVRGKAVEILKITAKLCLKNLLTYQYETGLASILAMEDVVKGKSFWEQNVSMSEKRPEIQKIISAEKVIDIPTSISSNVIWGNPNESKINKICRWVTLNGHLLPKIFFKKGIVWQNKGYGGNLREVYRYNKVLYIHWPTQKGFILEHDKSKFFRYLARYMKVAYKLYKNYDLLKKEYQSSYDELTSAEFWKKQFKQDQ